MKFREWVESDIDNISALEDECFNDPWSKQMLQDSFVSSNQMTLLCEEDNIVIGYALIGYFDDTADLMNIAVKKDYRKRGIGSSILEKIISKAKNSGVKRIFLEVRATNFPAQTLYTNQNFKVINVRKKYYEDGEDALIMVKKLEE